MQGDGQGNITDMEPNEIALFNLYMEQVRAGGRGRDDLPYTHEFDQLLANYNQATSNSISHRNLWLLLKQILKYGIANIQKYLGEYTGTAAGGS